jgi:hypothetical protein
MALRFYFQRRRITLNTISLYGMCKGLGNGDRAVDSKTPLGTFLPSPAGSYLQRPEAISGGLWMDAPMVTSLKIRRARHSALVIRRAPTLPLIPS